MELPLVTLEKVYNLLGEVLSSPDRFAIIQSESDIGTAQMQTLDKPHHYNKLFINLTFFDKTTLPGGIESEKA